jgi:hypothetical protein
VAFAVRTNIDYIPSPDDLCPITKAALAFQTKEFLHIKDVRENLNAFFEIVLRFRNLIMIGGLVD